MEEQPQTPPDTDAQDAQHAPEQDSGLQTPQPDQPVPTQEELHAQREQAKEQAVREHNERTGGGSVQDNERSAQRDEHNARTGGGVQE